MGLTEEQRAAQAKIVDEIIANITADEKSWKKTVQVGDYVDCHSDGFYAFSKKQYQTKGKLYRVEAVADESICAFGDYHDPRREFPEPIWLGPGKVIVRDGVVIWESSLQRDCRLALEKGGLNKIDRKTYENIYLNHGLPIACK